MKKDKTYEEASEGELYVNIVRFGKDELYKVYYKKGTDAHHWSKWVRVDENWEPIKKNA